MNNIENVYINYRSIIDEFTEDHVMDRYRILYQEIKEFLESAGIEKKVRVDEVVLMHAVLDYYSDVSRQKQFHKIDHINDMKSMAYETFWFLRRKPLQTLENPEQSELLAFVNEKFAFSRIAYFLVGSGKGAALGEEHKKGFLNYLDTFYYFLKYRNLDAQMLELMIMGFKAGVLIAEDLKGKS